MPRLRSPVLRFVHDAYAFFTRTEVAPHDLARVDTLPPHCTAFQALSTAFLTAYTLAVGTRPEGSPSAELDVPPSVAQQIRRLPNATHRKVATMFHHLRHMLRRQHALTQRLEAHRLAGYLRGLAPFQTAEARAHLTQLSLPGVSAFLKARVVPGLRARLHNDEFRVAVAHLLGLPLIPDRGFRKYCQCRFPGSTSTRVRLRDGSHLYYCPVGGCTTHRHDMIVVAFANAVHRLAPHTRPLRMSHPLGVI